MIDHARLFEANATVTMRRGKLRPGKYQLPTGMSNGAAIEALMQGPQAKIVKTFKFTLPEGRSRRENIPAVNKAFEGDYGKATTDPRAAAPGAQPRPAAQRALARGLPVPRDLPDDQRGERERPRRAPARRVPREPRHGQSGTARQAQPDPLRRAHHRLDGRARGAAGQGAAADRRGDAQPAQGGHPARDRRHHPLPDQQLARPLRVSELERDTPYNTRTRRGLPPTPIGNPGLASIRAAANPAKAKYLFFVRKPGKSGEHAFSSTNRQFERDVARYQASRGGP